jgi:anti-sigma B factor antagonist
MPVRRFPVRGDLDMAAVPDVQIKLNVLIDATTDDLVLDCSELTFIDSAGIGMFVHAHKALEVQGRSCRIENLSDRCRRPFDMLGLSEFLGLGELDPA